ncbi:MAG TPA: hypothetical protein VNQ78_09725 [Paracoccus sp. (in: a-proteobacteria)]|uniref:hypothetical protein n=1 Tax=Paracoccus sp. TaxID=267 RepID=UPI002C85399A|nr:hypothetical protein [Paracoccus sp. (in: a-proteobacteria)]HWL56936.1 hypothetical protein [Paracoccus sp. (in: a-proteobacteria)]
MRSALILPLLLWACASPAPGYFSVARQDIRVGDMDFAVFVKENEAEVIRLGYASRKTRDRLPAMMVEAAERASGCGAIPFSLRTRIPGDTGEARIGLDC